MKTFFKLFATLFLGLFIANCSNDVDMEVASQDAQTPVTRGVSAKTPKLTTYIETNDINPLNMGEYYFTGTDPKDYVVDHVILFASNIRGTKTTVELYHNNNQSHILANVNTLVRPLQDKGIKVLLGLLGDHTGIGFANLTSAQIDSFAQHLADCVATYGLDGVDFDDEYAEYGKISGTPGQSGTIFSQLVVRLRELMPNKLITAFRFGNAVGFNQDALDALDYMWPDFSFNQPAPAGFPNSKWARMSIHYTDNRPADRYIQSCAQNYGDAGAIMMFNVRNTDASAKMNLFASRVWGGKTVSWTGTSHPKDY